MEQRHRQIIKQNLVLLVTQTDLNRILPKLVEKEVFSTRMAEKYKLNKEPSLLKRELYMDLTRRGPYAFEKLIEVLLETGHHEVAQHLKSDLDIRQYMVNNHNENIEEPACSRHGTRPSVFPNYLAESSVTNRIQTLALEHPQSFFDLRTTPLKVKVKLATSLINHINNKHIAVYRMLSSPKGYALIINNVYFNGIEPVRVGANFDEKNLKDLLEGLGYSVIVWHDLGYQEMQRKIEEFCKRESHKLVDSCVVAIMSHGRAGEPNSHIICSDGGLLSEEWVINQFDNINCPNLQSKPKIFFFQTCRGSNFDYGTIQPLRHPEIRTLVDGRRNTPLRKYSDMLIAYCTVPGYISHRDKYLGTWFIQSICEVFMEYACSTDVEDMLKMVDAKIASLMSDEKTFQTTSYENRGFHRKFYFNPGIYETSVQQNVAVIQN